jgi:hypothetical protein
LKEQRRQEMKKLVLISLIAMVAIAFSSATMAAQPQPPGPNGNVIYGCYNKVNGQMRIVSAEGECRPSEIATFWNEGGTQGIFGLPDSPGMFTISTLSGSIGTIAGRTPQFVFAGPTVAVSTTDTQRISGVAQAPLGASAAGFASFGYDLCYRMMGSSSAPTNFAGLSGFSIGRVSNTAGRLPFTVAASIVPGAGQWEVGYCIFNGGAIDLDNNDFVNGWIMVTQ